MKLTKSPSHFIFGAASIIASIFLSPLAYAENYENFLGMKFITIPGGEFKMGAPGAKAGVRDDELPQHNVKVSSFQMMPTEMTLASYKRYIIESNRVKIVSDRFMNANGFENEAPVVFVSWNDIGRFLHWLNRNKPSEDTGTYRLPTEAEWEYACRAGEESEFCGSDSYSSVAWTKSSGVTHQQPVAQKKPNAFGLYDMSGNAREWVQDCYHESYKKAPTDGSPWSTECEAFTHRVSRGGSWNEEPQKSRATGRLSFRITSHSPLMGFRVVRDAQ